MQLIIWSTGCAIGICWMEQGHDPEESPLNRDLSLDFVLLKMFTSQLFNL